MNLFLLTVAIVVCVGTAGAVLYRICCRLRPPEVPQEHDPGWPSWAIDTEEWDVDEETREDG